jgi:hypothetical protein
VSKNRTDQLEQPDAEKHPNAIAQAGPYPAGQHDGNIQFSWGKCDNGSAVEHSAVFGVIWFN